MKILLKLWLHKAEQDLSRPPGASGFEVVEYLPRARIHHMVGLGLPAKSGVLTLTAPELAALRPRPA